MLKHINCNLCGSSNYSVVYEGQNASFEDKYDFACTNSRHGEFYRLVKCDSCGLLYSNPRPEGNYLEQKYTEVEDSNYKDEIEGRKKTFSRCLSNLSKYKSSGDLLDIGCALGVFLHEAKNAKWDVSGLEPSKWCVKQSEELFDSSSIICGTYKNVDEFGKKFDVVTMWDVLEHLDNPKEALKHCFNVLKKDGVLALTTVNIGSLYAKFLGKKWPWLMKMHIYYFTKRTINRYLKESGFEVLEIKTYKHIVSMDYLLYKLKAINSLLYSLVKFFKIVVLFNKNVFIPIGMGDFMEVYAKKTSMNEVSQ